jgi:hypothetical protein
VVVLRTVWGPFYDDTCLHRAWDTIDRAPTEGPRFQISNIVSRVVGRVRGFSPRKFPNFPDPRDVLE